MVERFFKKKREGTPLAVLIALSVVCLSPLAANAADTLKTQAEVDALLASGGDISHEVTGTNNVKPSEDLTFKAADGKPVSELAFTTNASLASLMISDNKTVSFEGSVQKLAFGKDDKPHIGKSISVNKNATLNVFSPIASVTSDYEGYDGAVYADDGGVVNFGDQDHVLKEVKIQRAAYSGESETAGIAVRAGSASSSEVNVIAQNMHISKFRYGIVANGSTNSTPFTRASVNIGSDAHWARQVTIDNSGIAQSRGIISRYAGDVAVYAKRVDVINANTGMLSFGNSSIVLHTGDGGNEGLHLAGHNATGPAAMWAYDDGQYKNSSIRVLSGNVNIQGFERGLYAGSSARGGQTIQLGDAGNPLNDVVIATNWNDIQNEGGNIGVYANKIALKRGLWNLSSKDAQTGNIDYGTTELHARELTLESGNISNTRGTVRVNTRPGDGAAKINGHIRTGLGWTPASDGTAETFVDVKGNEAYLNGSVHDDLEKGATTLTLADGGVWNLKPANYPYNKWDVDGLTVHSNLHTLRLKTGGVMNMHADSGYQTVYVKNLEGDGGTLVFDADLQASFDAKDVAQDSDKLYIGESSAGAHKIQVYDRSKDTGTAAEDGYLLLIADRSANPGATFASDEVQIQNGGIYPENKVAFITDKDPEGYANVPTGSKNWYLTVKDKPAPPTPPAPPEPPTPPTPPTPPAPDLTDNGYANVGYAQSRYVSLMNEQDTLRKRLGDLRHSPDDDGLWARVRHTEFSSDNFSGESQYNLYQLGYDKRNRHDKFTRFLGIAYNHSVGSQNFRRTATKGETKADALTLYMTDLRDAGQYLDLVAKVGTLKSEFDHRGAFAEKASGRDTFYSLSAEYGLKRDFGRGWYVEPQVQLTYSHLGNDGYVSTQNNHGRLDSVESLIFRTGVTFGLQREQNYGQYSRTNGMYGKLFWNRELKGDVSYRLLDKNGAVLSDSYDYGHSWWTIGLGADFALDKNSRIYVDVERNFGGKLDMDWLLELGVRWEL